MVSLIGGGGICPESIVRKGRAELDPLATSWPFEGGAEEKYMTGPPVRIQVSQDVSHFLPPVRGPVKSRGLVLGCLSDR